MNFRRLGITHRNEKGMTLVELLIAMAVTGIILGSITVTLQQVFAMNSRSLNHMTAVRQVQSAGYWVSQDALMAQTVNTENLSGPQDIVQLTWTEWDGVPHDIVYSIDNNSRLKRTNGASESIIASHIDPPPQTSCNITGGKLIFTVKATVGSGSTAGTETRVYEVTPRSTK